MIIDLSVHLDDRTPAYHGNPRYEVRTAGTFAHDGYCGHAISMGTHTGTHIDAPSHMLPEGGNIDLFPISQFVGRGRYIDASDGFSLEAVKYGVSSNEGLLHDLSNPFGWHPAEGTTLHTHSTQKN